MDNAIFGWTVSSQIQDSSTRATLMRVSATSMDTLLEKLWEREQPPEKVATPRYLDHYQRVNSGRYSVTLPRPKPPPELGESRPPAHKRFLANECSLIRRKALDSFNHNLLESTTTSWNMITLAMEKVPVTDLQKPASQHYYLPIHGVVKEYSSTTKFHASAKTTTGYSLNNQLLPTPSLYSYPSSISIKFRSHPVALSSDINEREEGRREEGRRWRMLQLTFEVASSPYLASQVLQQIAQDHQQEHPATSAVMKSTLYVDDCLSGAEDTPSANQLQRDLFQLLKKGGLTLLMWRNNDPAALSSIPEEFREDSSDLVILDPSSCAKNFVVH